MCGIPTIWLQALVTFWSLISSLTVINVWNSSNPEALAIVIMISCGFNLCTACIKPMSAAEWDLPLAQFRAIKHLYIAGVDVTFDIIIAIALYNGVDDITTEIALLEIGTLIGLFQEIFEFVMEAVMFCCDRAWDPRVQDAGFFLIVITAAVQFAAALFQGGILIHLISNVDGDGTFLGVGLTVSILMEIGLVCVCGTGFHELTYQPCCANPDGQDGQSPDASQEVQETAGRAGGKSIDSEIEMPGMDSVDTANADIR